MSDAICTKYGCDYQLDLDGQVTCSNCGAMDNNCTCSQKPFIDWHGCVVCKDNSGCHIDICKRLSGSPWGHDLGGEA